MIHETGTVAGIEPDCLWIETISSTTCGGCAARRGCGQRLIGKLAGKPNKIRVLLNNRSSDEFQLGDNVTVGIPEDIVVNGALLVYLAPLAGLLAGCLLGESLLPGEWTTISMGLAGLAGGAGLVRLHAWRSRHNPRYCPVLLE